MKNLNAEEQLAALLDAYDEAVLGMPDDEVLRMAFDEEKIDRLRRATAEILRATPATAGVEALPRRVPRARGKRVIRARDNSLPPLRRVDQASGPIHAFMTEGEELDAEAVLQVSDLAGRSEAE